MVCLEPINVKVSQRIRVDLIAAYEDAAVTNAAFRHGAYRQYIYLQYINCSSSPEVHLPAVKKNSIPVHPPAYTPCSTPPDYISLQ